jgi:hypothetical protein
MKTFIKYVLILGVLGFLVFDLGSPLWSRTAASGAAHDAAAAAAQDYFGGASLSAARNDANVAALARGATVTKMQLEGDGDIEVTVSRPTKAYLLNNISALKNWYNVTASATAGPTDPLQS